MNLTYQIKAADGQIYGPASIEELKTWITQARVDGDTQLCRSDQQAWVPAHELPELGLTSSLPPPPPPPSVAPPAASAATVPISVGAQFDSAMDDGSIFDPRIRDGANWFYWIGGFSLLNAVIWALGSDWGFALGLAIAGIFQGIGQGLVGDTVAGRGVGFALQLIPTGVTLALGWFAGQRRQRWAFILGMTGFVLDGLLYLLASSVVGVLIHAYALFAIFKGFRACGERATYLKEKGLPA